MARSIQVACATPVSVDTGGGLEELGLTANGVQIVQQDFWESVPTDENGGDAGPPSDELYHGEVHLIQLELTNWDDVVAGQIQYRTNKASPTAGQYENCKLMIGDSAAMRVLLNGPNFTRNYPRCIPKGPINLGPIGARYSRLFVTFVAYSTAGASLTDPRTLWNTTTV